MICLRGSSKPSGSAFPLALQVRTLSTRGALGYLYICPSRLSAQERHVMVLLVYLHALQSKDLRVMTEDERLSANCKVIKCTMKNTRSIYPTIYLDGTWRPPLKMHELHAVPGSIAAGPRQGVETSSGSQRKSDLGIGRTPNFVLFCSVLGNFLCNFSGETNATPQAYCTPKYLRTEYPYYTCMLFCLSAGSNMLR